MKPDDLNPKIISLADDFCIVSDHSELKHIIDFIRRSLEDAQESNQCFLAVLYEPLNRDFYCEVITKREHARGYLKGNNTPGYHLNLVMDLSRPFTTQFPKLPQQDNLVIEDLLKAMKHKMPDCGISGNSFSCIKTQKPLVDMQLSPQEKVALVIRIKNEELRMFFGAKAKTLQKAPANSNPNAKHAMDGHGQPRPLP